MKKPTAQKIFESTEGMTPECKEALRYLLLACADTKLLLGYHYGEWTFGPPEIEAAVACCSLCQSELGHVRLLHALLTKHYKDNPEKLVESAKPEEFANISYLDNEIKSWPDFVADNYIVDLAVTTLLFSMKNSSFKPLHMSLEKMLDEERYHIHHGQGWFRTLAKKSPETKQAIQESAQSALVKVVEWFGPPDSEYDRVLVRAGIKSENNSEILDKYLSELGNLAATLEVDLGLSKTNGTWKFNTTFDWANWDPKSRRLTKTGPDEEILYHLRGSKNKVFKLS